MVRIVHVPLLIPPSAHAQVLFPRVIFVRSGVALTRALIAHELQHVAQLEELGLLRYWLRYLRLLVRHGYERHPMEIQARLAETSVTRLQAAQELINHWKGRA